MRYLLMLLAVAFATPSIVYTDLKPALGTPPKANQLPQILARLRIEVPDAREITDLQMCEPRGLSRDGKRFTQLIAFNVPRSPREFVTFAFYEGRIKTVVVYAHSRDAIGFDYLAEKDYAKRLSVCSFVSASELSAGWATVDSLPGSP